MNSKWTIRKKLIVGFLSIIVLSVLFGTIAVFNMLGVSRIAKTMEQQYVPAATVANSVERTAMATRLSAVYYAFVNTDARLNTYRENIAKVQTHLANATQLAEAQNIEWLRVHAREATAATTEYDQQAKLMVASIAKMKMEEAASQVNAKAFMDVCESYIAVKERQIQDLAKSADAKASDILALSKQVTVVNNIVDEGNAIIIGTWYSIANRDPQYFLETQKRFATVDMHLNELRALTHDANDLALIEQNAAAGKAYSDNMDRFLVAWNQREDGVRF